MWRRVLCASLMLWAATAVACATRTPPAAPVASAWRQPDVPPDLAARIAETAAYQDAWTRIRRGDVRGGERALTDMMKRSPGFYPATASVGELRLQRQQYREAGVLFSQALSSNGRYLPALRGLVDARLGAGDDPGAMAALKAVLAVDPSRDESRGRLDAVALRVSQRELATAERLRAAGQWDDAERHLMDALEATPENGPVLRSLAAVALARGALADAEARARQAIALDTQDAASLALLGDVLAAQGRDREAAAAYVRAVTIDPRADWIERRASLQARADVSALPENYRQIEGVPGVTRAQVAAVLGVRLSALLGRAPARVTAVVTDVRGHWASPWILPVIRAGWIDVLPNHTFQPSGAVHRAELARIVVAVLTAVADARGKTVENLGSAKGAFADVPRDHASYRVVAIAVSAGIMTVDADRFHPGAVVNGRELLATIARLEPLSR